MTTGRINQVTVRCDIRDDTDLRQCRPVVKRYDTVVKTHRSFRHLTTFQVRKLKIQTFA